MQNLNEIRTSNWVLRLPGDWTDLHDQDRGFHFESRDGTKGLFLATHIIGPEHQSSVQELAEWFVNAELSTLAEMDGYLWSTRERSLEGAPEACVGLLDSFARAQDYRIVGKILARPGQVVRASFHDYHCHGYAASAAYFAPILASLQFVGLMRCQSPAQYH
jgi:hypothetical protein